MSAHTPGPWTYYTTPQLNGCPIIGSSRGLMVAMLSHSVNYESQSATAFANARLIAAAPELLEACRDALVALRLSAKEFVPEQAAIEAAIAKATAEQSA